MCECEGGEECLRVTGKIVGKRCFEDAWKVSQEVTLYDYAFDESDYCLSDAIACQNTLEKVAEIGSKSQIYWNYWNKTLQLMQKGLKTDISV